MVSSVTIQGSSAKPVTLGFDATSNFALAQQIAAQLNAGIASGAIVTEDDTGGSLPTLPSSVTGAYVQSTSSEVTLPSGYSSDLVTKSGNAVVFGSDQANQTILSDVTTNLTFVDPSGSGTVVAGGGTDKILVSGSQIDNWSLYTGGGNDIIAALGDVNATIGAGGGQNAILLGGGNNLVISTGDDSISGGSGSVTVDASGASSDFVQGESSHLLFLGGSGGATIIGGTGSDTYFGSGGPTGKQLIEGGSAGGNLLYAGDGAATLVGGGNNDQLYSYGGSNQLLIAGAGNETLSASFSTGNDRLTAGSGSDVLIGGTGADTFVGGSGQSTVTAGTGSDVFAFINHQAGGTELVQGIFDPASIKIDLEGYGAGAISKALASQTVQGGSVTIGLSDGTKVTFQDISGLTRSNFT